LITTNGNRLSLAVITWLFQNDSNKSITISGNQLPLEVIKLFVQKCT